MSKKFNIVIITPEGFQKNEIGSITKLFWEGLKTLHLRKPEATEDELRNFIELIPDKFHSRIVIHNHYPLLREFKLKGAHLPERIRRSAIPKQTKIISTSFHSIKKLSLSRRKYQYVFLSPIFESISKAGYKSNFNLEYLESFLKKHKNVIALGGVSDKNILSVKRSGFYGAAALGYIWEGSNPVINYKKLVSKIK